MRLDHIGCAVKDMDRARAGMEGLGWCFGETMEDHSRNVALAFGELAGHRVEVVAPLRGSAEGSPVDELLRKNGPTPYHLCYETDDMEADVQRLRSRRIKVTVPPPPPFRSAGVGWCSCTLWP